MLISDTGTSYSPSHRSQGCPARCCFWLQWKPRALTTFDHLSVPQLTPSRPLAVFASSRRGEDTGMSAFLGRSWVRLFPLQRIHPLIWECEQVSHSPSNSSTYPQIAAMASPVKSIFQTYPRCPHHRSQGKSWSSRGSCFSPSSHCPKTQQKFPAKASLINAEQSPIYHPALTSALTENPEILQKDFYVFSSILMIQGEIIRLWFITFPFPPFMNVLGVFECH